MPIMQDIALAAPAVIRQLSFGNIDGAVQEAVTAIGAPDWTLDALTSLLRADIGGAVAAIERVLASGESGGGGSSGADPYVRLALGYALNASGVPDRVLVSSEVVAGISTANASRVLRGLAASYGMPDWSVDAVVALASAADVPPRGLSGLFAGGGLSSAVLSVLSEHNISDAMESLGMATQYTAAVNEADVATLAALLGNAATLTTVVSGRRLSTAEQTAFGSALGRVALAVSTATQLQAAFRSKDPAFAVSAVVAFVGESNTPLGKAVDLAVKGGILLARLIGNPEAAEELTIQEIANLLASVAEFMPALPRWAQGIIGAISGGASLFSAFEVVVLTGDLTIGLRMFGEAVGIPEWILNGLESVVQAAQSMVDIVNALMDGEPNQAIVELCKATGAPDWVVSTVQALADVDFVRAKQQLAAAASSGSLLEDMGAADSYVRTSLLGELSTGSQRELGAAYTSGDAANVVSKLAQHINSPDWAETAFTALLTADVASAKEALESAASSVTTTSEDKYATLALQFALDAALLPAAVTNHEDIYYGTVSGNASKVLRGLAYQYDLPEWAVEAVVELSTATRPAPKGLAALLSGSSAGSRYAKILNRYNASEQLVALGVSALEYDTAVAAADARTLATLLGAASARTTSVSGGRRLQLSSQQVAMSNALGRVVMAISSAHRLESALTKARTSAGEVTWAILGLIGQSETPLGTALLVSVQASFVPTLLSDASRLEDLAPLVGSIAKIQGVASADQIATLAPLGELLGVLITAYQTKDYARAATRLASAAGLSGWGLSAFEALVAVIADLLGGGPLQQAIDALLEGKPRVALAEMANLVGKYSPPTARALKALLSVTAPPDDGEDSGMMGRLSAVASSLMGASANFAALADHDEAIATMSSSFDDAMRGLQLEFLSDVC